MKKIFAMAAALVTLGVGAANAADLPNTKGPPVFVPPPPAFTWTGFYVGAQAGYEWGRTTGDLYTDPGAYVEHLPGYDASGVVGGLHAGYNYQISQFVIGIEGDVEGSSYDGSGADPAGIAPFTSYTTRIPIQGSIRGRVGYAWDRVLFYATGGAEFADIENTFAKAGFTTLAPCPGFFAGPTPTCATAHPAGYDSFASGRVGWTVGGGVEYALDPNWIIRAEYRYTDFGGFNEYLVNTYPGDYARLHVYDNEVELGFSYKFDMFAPPAPVVAKY
jgi:outer membrane immunogenic protein